MATSQEDATSAYMSGRQKYARPQAILFADNPGIIQNGKIIPEGKEFENFIILSDDNRQPISFDIERIENRQRMINGRQRSYHVADKRSISTSWQMLCSRSFGSDPAFDAFGKTDLTSSTGVRVPNQDGTYSTVSKEFFTSDGGAGGVELLKWYQDHPGSFWVYLAYDKYDNFEDNEYNKLNQYNEVIEVFFSDFTYSVEKRGSQTHDYWNVDLSLEEV